MINGTNAGMIIGIILLETLSQTFARKYRDNAVEDDPGNFKWKKNFYLIAVSLLLYIPILAILVQTYKYSNFAISNAIWDSGTIIGTSLVGWLYFKESLNAYEITGMGLVVAGAILIGVKSEDKSLSE